MSARPGIATRPLVSAAVVALMLVSACGKSEPKNTPLDVLRAFNSALASGNGKRACDLLTDERRQQVNDDASVVHQNCEAKLTGLTKQGSQDAPDVKALASAHLGLPMITGDTATIEVDAKPFGTSEAQLEHQQDGKWRVSESAAGF